MGTPIVAPLAYPLGHLRPSTADPSPHSAPSARCPHLLSGQIKTPDHLQVLVEALPSHFRLAWFEEGLSRLLFSSYSDATMLPSPELLRRWLELSPRLILGITLTGLAAQWRHLGYIRYLVPERKLVNDDCQGTDICGLMYPNPVGRLPVKAAGRNEEPKPLISPLSGNRI